MALQSWHPFLDMLSGYFTLGLSITTLMGVAEGDYGMLSVRSGRSGGKLWFYLPPDIVLMNWVDYCILSIVIFSVLVGLLRGFVRETLGAATWIVAIIAASFVGPDAASHLSEHIAQPGLRLVAGYALVFFASLFIGALLTHLIGVLIESVGIGGIDRSLGAGFGLFRGVVSVIVVIMIASASSAPQERWWRDSVLIPPLMPAAQEARTWVPESWLAWIRNTEQKSIELRTLEAKAGALRTDLNAQTAAAQAAAAQATASVAGASPKPSPSSSAVHPAQGF